MKRLLFILLSIALVFSLFGCEKDEYIYEHFYGVVRYSEELERLIVYIPGVGEVEIPDAERRIAGFDGYRENESHSYVLKAGDFVCINFKSKKSWDEKGVQIMETYPAKFDRKATSIEALRENISFEKTDNGYAFSFSPSDTENKFNTGDSIYFVYYSGKNGFAYRKVIAEGRVTGISETDINVTIPSLDDEKEFFEKFTSMSFEKAWE